jgi:hypothetical protein
MTEYATDYNEDGYVPAKGIHRLKGKESVMIEGKMYWAPCALLDEFDRLRFTIECMQTETAIMYALCNSGMSEDEKKVLTYETGPYDITVLACGIRNFVKTLIDTAGESVKQEKEDG